MRQFVRNNSTSFYFIGEVIRIKLDLELISAVSGGAGNNPLEGVDLVPVEMDGLEGFFIGQKNAKWYVVVVDDGPNEIYRKFDSELEAEFFISLLRKAHHMYQRGATTEQVHRKIEKIVKQRTFSN